ncbi:hypothetical protein EB809_03345 [Marinobacter sp. R17]|uniref:hypothetical protein n=1 Tax=Marinobacter TaxID=2742 RepID=UPI000F4B1FA1|nr:MULTISPECIES: hypothetical protein [Marinobacter]ROU01508.1 hypothetical protein EB809_03345 [Marinobacter sp. R17]
MNPDALAFISRAPVLVVAGGLACLIALAAFVVLFRQVRRQQEEVDYLERRINTLWQEADAQVGGEGDKPDAPSVDVRPRAGVSATERAAYDTLWPLAWELHDRIGTFLRAIDHHEPISDTRLAARHAALDLRRETNRLRPFIDADIDHLLHQLLDAEVKAHLAACQFLDNRDARAREGSENSSRWQWQEHHEQEAVELMNQLVTAIRKRVL